MRKQLLLLIALIFIGFSAQAQTLQELKEQVAAKEAMIKEHEASIADVRASLSDLNDQINFLSGWRKGVAGLVGFNLNRSNNWVGNANPDSKSSALNLDLSGYANYDKPKYFWNNKILVTETWQDIDLNDDGVDDNLFDNAIKDNLNVASLGGYKIHPKFALSGLGELNTSLRNFLEPGVLDIGVGGTWLPTKNLTVVFHPLNAHIAWLSEAIKVEAPDQDNPITTFGAKLRADYTDNIFVLGKKMGFSSTFTSFLPYSDNKFTFTDADGNDVEVGAFEWTWLNNVSFEVWNGIGVGVGFGLRDASFESNDIQSYYNLGLTYGF